MRAGSINNKYTFTTIDYGEVAYGLFRIFFVITENLINKVLGPSAIVLDLDLAKRIFTKSCQYKAMLVPLKSGTRKSPSLIEWHSFQTIVEFSPVFVQINLRLQGIHLIVPVNDLDAFQILSKTLSPRLLLSVEDLYPINTVTIINFLLTWFVTQD